MAEGQLSQRSLEFSKAVIQLGGLIMGTTPMRIKQFSRRSCVLINKKSFKYSLLFFFLFSYSLVRSNLHLIKHTDQEGLVSDY